MAQVSKMNFGKKPATPPVKGPGAKSTRPPTVRGGGMLGSALGGVVPPGIKPPTAPGAKPIGVGKPMIDTMPRRVTSGGRGAPKMPRRRSALPGY